MNILLISPYFRPMVGGVETHLDDLCKYLESRKHKVFVRTYKALGVKNRGKTNESNKYLKIHRLWWSDFNLIFRLEKYSALKFLYLFIGLFFDCFIFLLKNSGKIDVIQAHGFIAGFMGVILGKLFKKRVVVNTHVGFNLSKSFMTNLIKWTLLSADKILVLTKGIKQSLVNLGIPDNKITVYHYWVDQKIFSPVKNANVRLGWKDKFVVLFVGRLIEVKGVRVLLDLAKNLKNVTFAIIGSGPLEEELREKSKKYSNVEFIGRVKNADLPAFYSGADILLIPSKIIKQEYEEGIPRVMIEAISCGTPVIATKTGGIQDVFNDQIGELVEDNVKSILKAIKNIFEGKTKVKNVRSYAIKLFSVQNAKTIEEGLKQN